VHESRGKKLGNSILAKLKDNMPQQQFEIRMVFKVDNKPMGRAVVKAIRKDVTWKLHAADLSRWRKLLDKQKKGKNKLREIGNISVSKEAIQNIMKL